MMRVGRAGRTNAKEERRGISKNQGIQGSMLGNFELPPMQGYNTLSMHLGRWWRMEKAHIFVIKSLVVSLIIFPLWVHGCGVWIGDRLHHKVFIIFHSRHPKRKMRINENQFLENHG